MVCSLHWNDSELHLVPVLVVLSDAVGILWEDPQNDGLVLDVYRIRNPSDAVGILREDPQNDGL